MSNIEWTDKTWNPLRGCSRVSQGCVNCYAERQAARHAGLGRPYEGLVMTVNGHPTWTGEVRTVPDKLTEPLTWRKPCRVFVNSMSDLFHEAVPDEYIDRVFAVMALGLQHTFQVLTKRPERMRAYLSTSERALRWFMAADDEGETDCWPHEGRARELPHLPNVWLGVSVEDQATADERTPLLLATPAAVRFVSYEPALGPVDFQHLQPGDPPTEIDALNGTHGVLRPHRGTGPRIDWLIVGGESGPGARPCDVAWIRSAVQQCQSAGVPVFVKQLGARLAVGMTNRKGADPAEWPADLRVREWPR